MAALPLVELLIAGNLTGSCRDEEVDRLPRQDSLHHGSAYDLRTPVPDDGLPGPALAHQRPAGRVLGGRAEILLPDDLQPAAGEELRSLFRPPLTRGHLRTPHRGRPGSGCSTAGLAQSLLNRFDADRRPPACIL